MGETPVQISWETIVKVMSFVLMLTITGLISLGAYNLSTYTQRLTDAEIRISQVEREIATIKNWIMFHNKKIDLELEGL